MTRWIQVWEDDGTLTANDHFSEDLADENEVTDDEDAWQAYLIALAEFRAARRRVIDSLRSPTDAERDEYRAKILAVLSVGCQETPVG